MTNIIKMEDVSFYVMALDTTNDYKTIASNFNLSLNSAIKYYKEYNSYDKNINIMLGVEYDICMADLIQRIEGSHKLTNDFELNNTIKASKIISLNVKEILKNKILNQLPTNSVIEWSYRGLKEKQDI